MKTLITGGAGFIGYHLTNYLLKNTKADLVLIDNFTRGKWDAALDALRTNPRVTFIELDLTDQDSYSKLGSGYNHVYHLAAINGTKNFYEIPHEVLRINMQTLEFMLEWFRKNNNKGKFLFTSSNEAYAGALEAFNQLPIPTPENVPLVISDTYNPRWTYAASKLIGELFVINYAAQYKFKAVIVRPHNFYGPRAGKDHVIPEFSLRIKRREDPFIISGADNTRSFCYIDDAVRAMAELMKSKTTNNLPIETVHIGAREEISMENLAKKLFVISGWKPKKIVIKQAPEGSVLRRLPDISKIEKLIGWKPEIDLDDGLKRTYKWYISNYKLL